MKRFQDFVQKNIYGISIFCILALYMYSKSDKKIDEDILCSYVIGYKTGFGARKLIASIVCALSSNPTLDQIRLFAYTISTAICAVFAWLCNAFILKMKAKGESSFLSALFLLAFYLSCPASIMFLLKYPNFGRLDFLLYGICLVFCVLFYNRERNRHLYYSATTLLLIIGILSHHIFVATYMPFLVALFIYDIWSIGFSKRIFTAHVIMGIISGATLLCVLLFSSMNIELDEATHINSHFELSRKFVCFGYYAHLSDHIEQYVIAKWPRLVAGILLTIVFLSPLFLAFWKIWRQTYLSLSCKKDRHLLIGMQCAFLLFIPAFCITVDYLRWFGAFIFLQTLLIAYFAYDTQSTYSNVWAIFRNNLRQYAFFAAVLLIYCVSLDYFYSDTYFDIVELIMQKMHIYRVETLLPLEYRL